MSKPEVKNKKIKIRYSNIDDFDLKLTYTDTHVISPQDMRWECKSKLSPLGHEGKERLILFMKSIGFECDDMPDDNKRRFFVKEVWNRPNESLYLLAVGACLCLGYDCVKKAGEIIVVYKGETE